MKLLKPFRLLLLLFILSVPIAVFTGCSEMILLFDYAVRVEENFDPDDSVPTTPVDILMVIDTSGSMVEEINSIQNYLNSNFVAPLENKQIDYHFMLLAADKDTVDPTNINDAPIIVPQSLKSNPRFKHINRKVHSMTPFSETVSHWTEYSSFMRDPSLFNIIVITDDKDELSFNEFKTEMGNVAIDRDDFILHGIVGINLSDKQSGLIADIGQQYLDGILATGGVQCNITTPFAQWSTLFSQIAQSIIQSVNATFPLKEDALSYGFHVYINGVEQVGNWKYNSHSNTVTLLNVIFKPGDIVKIVYNTAVQVK